MLLDPSVPSNVVEQPHSTFWMLICRNKQIEWANIENIVRRLEYQNLAHIWIQWLGSMPVFGQKSRACGMIGLSFVVTLLDPWAPILLSTVIEQPRSKLGPCNYRVSHISKVLASPSHIAQWSQVSACELPHFHGWTTGCNSCNLSLYQER